MSASRFNPDTVRTTGTSQPGQRGGRAVVKANYVKAGDGTRQVKESAYYYMTRPNDQGEAQERSGFSNYDDRIGREEVYARLDEAGRTGGYHYRLVVSPGTDRNAENVDMKSFARDTMNRLEVRMQKTLSWVAFEHSGGGAHTEHGHVHLIVTTSRRLDREDFEQLRDDVRQSFGQALENRPEHFAELGGGLGKTPAQEQHLGLEGYEGGLEL